MAIVQIALVGKVDSLVEKRHRRAFGLLHILVGNRSPHFEQRLGYLVATDEQIAEMRSQTRNKVLRLESFAQNFVESEQRVGHAPRQKIIDQTKIVVVVEHIQIFDNTLISNVAATKTDHLVENGECVAHGTIGLLRNHIQRLWFGRNALVLSHILQMADHIGHANSAKIVDLTARQNRWNNFVLFGSGENENSVCWRLFERFQKGVERRRREHVHLVDDIDAVTPDLRRNAHLIDQRANVVHRIVRGSIEFVYVERALLVESAARFALVAGFAVGGWVRAVDSFGKNACAGGFAHATRTAKEVSVRQMVGSDGIFERRGECLLPYYRLECCGTIFARRYDVLFHKIPLNYSAKIMKIADNATITAQTFFSGRNAMHTIIFFS